MPVSSKWSVGVLWFMAISMFCSCDKEEKRVFAEYTQQGDLKLKVDTLLIDIDEQTSYAYMRFNTFDVGNDFYLISYNRAIHTLQFFSLERKKLIKTVALERGGVNGINDIQNLYVHSLDSIFVFDSGNMKIIDDRGRVSLSLNLFEVAAEEFRPGFAGFMSKPFFNQSRNSVIFGNAHNPGVKSQLSVPIVIELDLKTKQFKPLNFYHAAFFLEEDGAFGPYSQVNVASLNDSMLLYNYQVESSVFVQNLNGSEPLRYDGTVSGIKPRAQTFRSTADFADVMKYRHETPQYYDLLYDPYRQLYYRVHRTGKPFNQSESNVLRNTTFFLAVFDKELKLIKELELPQNVYSQYTWFVSPAGLCFSASFPDYELLQESKMILHAFDFYFD